MNTKTDGKRAIVTSVVLCVVTLIAFGFLATALVRLAHEVAEHTSYLKVDARRYWQMLSQLHAADAACQAASEPGGEANVGACVNLVDAAASQASGELDRTKFFSSETPVPLESIKAIALLAESVSAAVRQGNRTKAHAAAFQMHERVRVLTSILARAEGVVWAHEAREQTVARAKAQSYDRVLRAALGFFATLFLGVFAFLTWRHGTVRRLARYRDTLRTRDKIIAASKEQVDLGIMAAGIAHEINNPLTAILGFSQMLRMMVGQQRPSDVRLCDYVRRIESQAEKIAFITQNLCSIRVGDPRADAKRRDLKAIANVAVELLADRFDSLGVELSIEVPPECAWVRCIETEVFHVLHSLLTNAAEAALASQHSQGPSVWLRILSVPGSGALGGRPAHVRLEVEDNGPGIPADVREKIFVPFFSTKLVGSGAHGLGLSVASSLVARQGGKIYVDPSRKNTCLVVEFLAS